MILKEANERIRVVRAEISRSEQAMKILAPSGEPATDSAKSLAKEMEKLSEELEALENANVVPAKKVKGTEE